MLTKMIIKNFKYFDCAEIELGNPVVFMGPNNSGKTTALQALSLWDIGLRMWTTKRQDHEGKGKGKGVTINRRDLIAIPIPDANLLWRDLHVRDVQRIDGKPDTKNVRIDILVEGVTPEKEWKCGIEFDYANNESLYCRPLRADGGENAGRMKIPPEAMKIRLAYLPPMSGLAANETRLDPGAVNVRLGEGRTAEVLRNLCYQVYQDSINKTGTNKWNTLCVDIDKLFGVSLEIPRYVPERGEITMSYKTMANIELDLSCSGRGLQQTLLLLAYMSANPHSVLLLDEPDAHLEILRQRQIYQILSEAALENESQIIAASHSEVILDEAAGRDVVIAFVGKPHRIDNRGSHLLKCLRDIGFDHYYQAEQKGWVLYLEGSTDLAILRKFAAITNHPVRQHLEQPFANYICNQPRRAQEHFFGLKEAYPQLLGFLLCDRTESEFQQGGALEGHIWRRREIENYFAFPETLMAYAKDLGKKEAYGPLFESVEISKREALMRECIKDFAPPAALRDYSDPWWNNTKISDEFIDRVFESFFKKLEMTNLMRKTNYHILVQWLPENLIDQEIKEVLGSIYEVALKAKPVSFES